MKRLTNICFVMEMTKSFLDGKIDCISYALDFPHEVTTRYRRLVAENRDYTNLILECLVTAGTDHYDELPNDQFKRLIRKQYLYIKKVTGEGFF